MRGAERGHAEAADGPEPHELAADLRGTDVRTLEGLWLAVACALTREPSTRDSPRFPHSFQDRNISKQIIEGLGREAYPTARLRMSVLTSADHPVSLRDFVVQ